MKVSSARIELITNKLKPHSEGEFGKECLVGIVKLLMPDKVKLFQSVSLLLC